MSLPIHLLKSQPSLGMAKMGMGIIQLKGARTNRPTRIERFDYDIEYEVCYWFEIGCNLYIATCLESY